MKIESYQRNDIYIYMTIRKNDGTVYPINDTNVIFTFEVENSDKGVEIIKTDGNGVYVYDSAKGILQVHITKLDTDIPTGEYRYELKINNNGFESTFINDALIIKESIIS